jgi:hypothetical protein
MTEQRPYGANHGISNTGPGSVHVTGSAVGTGNVVQSGAGVPGQDLGALLDEVRSLIAEHRAALAEPDAVGVQVETFAAHVARTDRDRGYLLYLLAGVREALEVAGVVAAPVAALAAAVVATFNA